MEAVEDFYFSNRTITDLLNVDLANKDGAVNRPAMVVGSPASSLVNLPFGIPSSETYIAKREVCWFDRYHVLVVLTEAYPYPGRVWTNFYNVNNWSGWKRVVATVPEVPQVRFANACTAVTFNRWGDGCGIIFHASDGTIMEIDVSESDNTLHYERKNASGNVVASFIK